MNNKEIIDLLNYINESGLEAVKIETDKIKIDVKRSAETKTVFSQAPMSQPQPVQTSVSNAATTPQAPSPSSTPAPKATGIEIKSPMIGTFYRSANPESPPFVNEGDMVNKGDTICIIEAMKLFNEIEADETGIIVKCLVDDKSPVEFDQPLFLIKKA